MILLNCSHLMRHSLIQLPHLSNLLQVPNDHRMVDVAFIGRFLCSLRGSALMLSVGHCQLLMAGHYSSHLQGRRLPAKLLEPLLHWTFVISSWAKCIVVVSCLCCFMAYLNKKIAQTCFFVLTLFPQSKINKKQHFMSLAKMHIKMM